MATSVRAAQVEPFVERVVGWIKGHRQTSGWVATILVVGAVLFVWNLSSTRRSETIAGRQLQGARYAFDNENLPLAANELSRIVENYSGTRAADEARLLLAQVRLLQGQPAQVVELLRDYAPGARALYRAQAFGLLAAAHENVGQQREAAETYERAANASRMDFLKAQFLSDAGRAWVAVGDSAKAIASYRRIVAELPETPALLEAKVRLGELTKGTL